MRSSEEQNSLIPNIITSFFDEKIFPDLKLILYWLVLAIIFIYVPVLKDTPIRIIFTLPIVLFIPGYCLITALFPGKKYIDIIERVALSFGLSIAIVPLIGLGLNYTPFGIRLDPIVTSLTIFSISMILISQYQRGILPVDERYVFPINEYLNQIKEEFFNQHSSRFDKILSIILFISITTAIVTTVYVIVVPKEGEKFTEFFILGEKGMASDYPTILFDNEQYPMYIGVGNHEYRTIMYTIETYLEDMEFHNETNTSSITGMILLNVTNLNLTHNQTVIIPYNLSVTSDLPDYHRIEFLLFNETLPDVDVKNMDRLNVSANNLHLWIKKISGDS